jgi:hypothetical protein
MKAKDTVMPVEGRILLSYVNSATVDTVITEVLNKQAEISFKAGIKEVAEW